MERAIGIALDSRFVSVLEVEDGALEGEVRLMLTLDGATSELTLFARGRTDDPDSNFATPDFVSLLLELDFDEHDEHDEYGDFDEKGRGRFGHPSGRHFDDDHHRRGRHDDHHHGRKDDDDGRFFLQAQGPVVPEPGTFTLLGGGLLALALVARSRAVGAAERARDAATDPHHL
jgi:hypothetical protein